MNLFKRMLSVLLVMLMFGMNILPVMAEMSNGDVCSCKTSKTFIHDSTVIGLSFINDFNVNESEVGDIVKFRLDQEFKDVDGDYLPLNTIFYGRVNSVTKSKMGYRKASAHINMTSMVLPDGRKFDISATPVKENLTSPAVANVAKGVATSMVAACVCIFGATAIAIECLSVGGIIFAPITGTAIGVAVATTSKGLNYKVPAGTKISIKFDRPVNLF